MYANEEITTMGKMKDGFYNQGALKALVELHRDYGDAGIDLIVARNLSPELISAIYAQSEENVHQFYKLLNT